MANITGRRMTAEIDGDFVVFLIGARFNSFHLVKTVLDLGGRRGMKHMLDYLVAHPEKGLLGYQMGLPSHPCDGGHEKLPGDGQIAARWRP